MDKCLKKELNCDDCEKDGQCCLHCESMRICDVICVIGKSQVRLEGMKVSEFADLLDSTETQIDGVAADRMRDQEKENDRLRAALSAAEQRAEKAETLLNNLCHCAEDNKVLRAERDAWKETAERHCRNEDYYRNERDMLRAALMIAAREALEIIELSTGETVIPGQEGIAEEEAVKRWIEMAGQGVE